MIVFVQLLVNQSEKIYQRFGCAWLDADHGVVSTFSFGTVGVFSHWASFAIVWCLIFFGRSSVLFVAPSKLFSF